MQFVSNSPEESLRFSRSLGKKIPVGSVLLLSGDLGAGKTAFTRGFASAFSIENDVTSPTYSLLNIYEGSKTIYHMDLYRLSDPAELLDLGIRDLPEEADFVLIEWPEMAREFLPEKSIEIEIRIGEHENQRIYEIKNFDG